MESSRCSWQNTGSCKVVKEGGTDGHMFLGHKRELSSLRILQGWVKCFRDTVLRVLFVLSRANP